VIQPPVFSEALVPFRVDHVDILTEPDAQPEACQFSIPDTVFGLTQRQLADTLGLSGPTTSRLYSGKYRLSATRSKEWELGVLFVRLFRSLDALWGHEGTARAWLETYNTALGAAPLELIRTIHSFDPCLACGVHVLDMQGTTVTEVKVQ
jgi:hypothetical protein